MKYIHKTSLTENEKAKITKLFACCAQHDDTSSFSIDPFEMNVYKSLPHSYFCFEDEKLVGYAQIFMPDKDELEITACVDPEYRRRGIFNALSQNISQQIKAMGLENARKLFVVSEDSAVGEEIAKKRGLEKNRVEYTMQYDRNSSFVQASPKTEGYFLEQLKQEEAQLFSLEFAKYFGGDPEEEQKHMDSLLSEENVRIYLLKKENGSQTVGSASVRRTERELYIFGLWVREELRGMGYGKILVKLVVEECLKKEFAPIVLEVDTLNPAALSLYKKSGFCVKETKNYYISK